MSGDLSFAQKLQKISLEAQGNNDPSITQEEIDKFILSIKHMAEIRAMEGHEEVCEIINFRRKGLPPMPRGSDSRIIKLLEAEGFKAGYLDNIDCGFCDMKHCEPFTHFGYWVSW